MGIEEKVFELIEKSINDIGIRLHSVTYEREDGNNFLRIVIDKDTFINIDDCVNVTKLINPMLDEADIIDVAYILDVCSKEKESE